MIWSQWKKYYGWNCFAREIYSVSKHFYIHQSLIIAVTLVIGQFVAFENQSIIMRISIFPTEPLNLPFFNLTIYLNEEKVICVVGEAMK